jgi:hypothetical protein
VAWRQTLGPLRYAFDLGPFRFIGLNTYDGSPERRHAFSIWVDIKGLHLGAPMVDNYGGYLSEAQLRWLRAEIAQASAARRPLVVFGHHDPRGNASGDRYHPNQAFPTDPVGPSHFEQWNYDGAWDSNPRDRRGRERATRHSGHALLRLLARHGGVYLSGHVHRDERRRYAAGASLPGGIRARRGLTFVKVTTASSAPKTGGYWGYRLLTAHPDGRLDTRPFATRPTLPSVPVGNLWSSRAPASQVAAQLRRGEAALLTTLHTGLPRRVGVRVRARLPRRAAGYRFRGSPAGRADPAGARITVRHRLPLPGGREVLYDLRVRLPAAPAAALRDPAALRHVRILAEPTPSSRKRR